MHNLWKRMRQDNTLRIDTKETNLQPTILLFRPSHHHSSCLSTIHSLLYLLYPRPLKISHLLYNLLMHWPSSSKIIDKAEKKTKSIGYSTSWNYSLIIDQHWSPQQVRRDKLTPTKARPVVKHMRTQEPSSIIRGYSVVSVPCKHSKKSG